MHSLLAQQLTNPLASTDSPLLDSSEINQDLSGGAGGVAERGVPGRLDGCFVLFGLLTWVTLFELILNQQILNIHVWTDRWKKGRPDRQQCVYF